MDKQKEFLAWLMQQTSLTQAELAQRLGISASLVSRLARGERRLTLSMLRQIATTFGLSQAEVFASAGVLERPAAQAQQVRSHLQAEDGDQSEVCLQAQLQALRDPRRALAWALEGKLPRRTIEKLQQIVELELEYRDTTKAD